VPTSPLTPRPALTNRPTTVKELLAAAKARPDDAAAWVALGQELRACGSPSQAVVCLRRAVDLRPDLLVLHPPLAQALAELDPTQVLARQADFARCLGLAGTDPRSLTRGISTALRHDPAIAPLIAAANAGDDAMLVDAVRTCAPGAGLGQPLLLRWLRLCRATDASLEALLTALRRALRVVAAEAPLSPAARALAAGIAHAAWRGEYVWDENESDRSHADAAWDGMAAALLAGRPPSADAIILLAGWRDLVTLPGARALADRPPDNATPVVLQQVSAPLDERARGRALPSLAALTDTTSKAVAAQYEVHPYPRWERISARQPLPLARVLAKLLPHTAGRLAPLPTPLNVLVAGCGTGRHALTSAGRFAGARVTALDLSRASLGFAARKSAQSHLDKNITWMHGDLLQLRQLGRRFHLIECAGVLHHMADPMAGWSALCEVLAPGGVMSIALYSELGRQPVVAAREWIADQGLEPTLRGLRAARAGLRALPQDHPARPIVDSPDFSTASELRDLIFHVQEHRFTVPKIAASLDTLNLEFLGFELPSDKVRSAYVRAFPDDPRALDLSNWARFEAAHPSIFQQMYTFWARRRDDGGTAL
jgi:SAM-dependent methyltransferase